MTLPHPDAAPPLSVERYLDVLEREALALDAMLEPQEGGDGPNRLRAYHFAEGVQMLRQVLDAYAAAIEARVRGECIKQVEGVTRYRGIKQGIRRNGDMVVDYWHADEEKHHYCANVLKRDEVLAALAPPTGAGR